MPPPDVWSLLVMFKAKSLKKHLRKAIFYGRWGPAINIWGATKQKQRLGCFWKFGFFPIFSLYTYWTMYSVNFKSFRLKMTSESLISRYVVQNTTFEISPFKVSSHIPWYNKCTMKILKKKSWKNASHVPIFSQITDKRPMMEKKRKRKKNRIHFFDLTT